MTTVLRLPIGHSTISIRADAITSVSPAAVSEEDGPLSTITVGQGMLNVKVPWQAIEHAMTGLMGGAYKWKEGKWERLFIAEPVKKA